MLKLLRSLIQSLFTLCFVLIFLVNMSFLTLYTMVSFTADSHGYLPHDVQNPLLKYCALVALPVLLLTAVILYFPSTRRRTIFRSSRRVYRHFFNVLSLCFFLFLLLDSGKPVQRYTIADLNSSSAEQHESTALLIRLFYQHTESQANLRPLMKAESLKHIERQEQEIVSAWKAISGQRAVIDRLKKHDTLLLPSEHDTSIFFPDGRKLGYIYTCYSLLLARKGDMDAAIENLSDFHNLTRRGLEGSVNLIQKMIWIVMARENLRTALQLLFEYPLDEKQIRVLNNSFTPFTTNEASFYKPWIGEYLQLLNQLDLTFFKTLEEKLYQPEENSTLYQLAKLLPESLVEAYYQLSFHRNRTAGRIIAFWEPIIKHAKIAPEPSDSIPNLATFGPLPLRNIGGWYLHHPPQYLAYHKRMLHLKEMADVLGKYLKTSLSTFSEAPSPIHHPQSVRLKISGKLTSNGQDNIAGTNDDISLEIYYR